MKRYINLALLSLVFASCHETLSDRAEREAREYTERNCPTPVINYTRTDSVGFDRKTNNYIYYCSFVDVFDDETVINENRNQIHQGLHQAISSNAGLKAYIDAGFSFTYVVRSGKQPSKVLYKDTIKIKRRSK
jgi:hypothetical protein